MSENTTRKVPRTEITNPQHFANFLRVARIMAGLSADQLARKIGGVGGGAIRAREVGERACPMPAAIDTLDVLGYRIVIEPVEPDGPPVSDG